MKNALKKSTPLFIGTLLLIGITASAWQFKDRKQQDSTATNGNNEQGDTTKPKQLSTDKDGGGIGNININLDELNEQLKNLDIQLDGLDTTIQLQVENALKNINLEKMKIELDNELKKVDWDKIKLDVDNSLKEAKEQMEKIDMKQVEEQMEKLKEQFNSEAFKESLNLDKIHEQVEKEMEHAKEELEKSNIQLENIKAFTDALQKDGLIDKNKQYKIEWKDGGSLYINGVKQSKEISEKYKKFYNKDGFKIELNGDKQDGESL